MSAASTIGTAVALAAACGLTATPVRAQPPVADARALAARVAAAGDGEVRFHYAVRDGVCGDGAQNVSVSGPGGELHAGDYVHDEHGRWARRPCLPGPARVTLAVRGGAVRAVRLAVGGPPSSGAERVVDLGAVPAAAAAAYLLDLPGLRDVARPERAILAAVVADSAVVWPRLLTLARDAGVPTAARRDAAFWASRYACDASAAARPPRSATGADTADRDVRKQVVFALSQRPAGEAEATLVRVARADRDPAVRCSALFWLGQGSRGGATPRALDLYEELLRGR